MRRFHITAKNYRCFEDSNPLRITIQDGFIALVGPNNSGKSSCLKLFYEFRNIWASLQNVDTLVNLNTRSNTIFNYAGAFDNDEIYCDANNRNLSLDIELELEDISQVQGFKQLTRIELICDRPKWRANLYVGNNHQKLSKQRVEKVETEKLSDFLQNMRIDCSKFLSLFRDLNSSFYIGPFRNAISEGGGSYFDLQIGTAFIKQWNSWKTGASKKANLLIEKITEDIRNIFDFKSLEINMSQELKTLQFIIDKKPYKLKELGAGISQFVIVLGNIAIKKPAYLLIDEPELNLHPSLQLDFLTTI